MGWDGISQTTRNARAPGGANKYQQPYELKARWLANRQFK